MLCDNKTSRLLDKIQLCVMLNKLPSEIENEKAVNIELLAEYFKAKLELKKNAK